MLRNILLILALLGTLVACKAEKKTSRSNSAGAPAVPTQVSTQILLDMPVTADFKIQREDKVAAYMTYESQFIPVQIKKEATGYSFMTPALPKGKTATLVVEVYEGGRFLFAGVGNNFTPDDKQPVKISSIFWEKIFPVAPAPQDNGEKDDDDDDDEKDDDDDDDEKDDDDDDDDDEN